MASPAQKKKEEASLKMLRELVALPHNKQCFECQQRGPTYADMTTCAFLCTQCSGFLRGINPPHRVKSVSMTTFSSDEVQKLRNGGNEMARMIWLGKWDPKRDREPTKKDEQAFREYLRDKYERKKWYRDPSEVKKDIASRSPEAASTVTPTSLPSLPPPSQQGSSRPVTTAPAKAQTPQQQQKAPTPIQPAATKQNEVSLLDISDPVVTSPPTGGVSVFPPGPPPVSQSLNQPQPPLAANNDFGAFTSSGAPTGNFLVATSSGSSVGQPPSSSPAPPLSLGGGGAGGNLSAADRYSALASLDQTLKDIRLQEEEKQHKEQQQQQQQQLQQQQQQMQQQQLQQQRQMMMMQQGMAGGMVANPFGGGGGGGGGGGAVLEKRESNPFLLGGHTPPVTGPMRQQGGGGFGNFGNMGPGQMMGGAQMMGGGQMGGVQMGANPQFMGGSPVMGGAQMGMQMNPQMGGAQMGYAQQGGMVAMGQQQFPGGGGGFGVGFGMPPASQQGMMMAGGGQWQQQQAVPQQQAQWGGGVSPSPVAPHQFGFAPAVQGSPQLPQHQFGGFTAQPVSANKQQQFNWSSSQTTPTTTTPSFSGTGWSGGLSKPAPQASSVQSPTSQTSTTPTGWSNMLMGSTATNAGTGTASAGGWSNASAGTGMGSAAGGWNSAGTGTGSAGGGWNSAGTGTGSAGGGWNSAGTGTGSAAGGWNSAGTGTGSAGGGWTNASAGTGTGSAAGGWNASPGWGGGNGANPFASTGGGSQQQSTRNPFM